MIHDYLILIAGSQEDLSLIGEWEGWDVFSEGHFGVGHDGLDCTTRQKGAMKAPV